MRFPQLLGLFLTAACGGDVARATAAAILVHPNGSGDFPTIQAAIDAAFPGDIVLLAPGVFSGAGNRDLSFRGKAITVRSQAGFAANSTIDCGSASGDPHRAFEFTNGEGTGSILEAVTLSGGLAWDLGGAVLCQGASPTLRGLEITGSHAGYGGGLACEGGAAPLVDRCVFQGNRADFGSAVACRSSSPRFVDCRFEANDVAEIGGGVLCEWESHPQFDHCLFANNEAEIGGGLACRDGSNPLVYRCRFLRNRALAGGGEGGGAWCANSSPVFQECIFAFNEASGHGGALVAVIAAPQLARCTLLGNRAPKGAGVYSWLDAAPSIGGSIVAFSVEGEAVACEHGGTASIACSNMFGNEGGDWVGAIAGQLALTGNFSTDPGFCDPTSEAATLRADSPCRPGQHPHAEHCGTLGAVDAPCAASAGADLRLVKRVDRPNVAPGSQITYTITLFNLGPETARSIVFGDPLPDPLNLLSFAASRGTVHSGSYCALDSLAPGDSVTANLIAVPIANPAPSERFFENTAFIDQCATPDPETANNQSSVWARIADLPSDAPSDSPGAIRLAVSSELPGTTRVRWVLPAADATIDLAVFDVRGRRIANLARGAFEAGEHSIDWQHARTQHGTPAGIYWVRLRSSAGDVSRKVRLLR